MDTEAVDIRVFPTENVFQSLVHDFDVGISAKADVELRIKLIQEEAQEYLDAVEAKNAVEVIDALCDLLYVVYGAADVMNLGVLDTRAAELIPPAETLNWALLNKELPDFNQAVNSAITYLRYVSNPFLQGESHNPIVNAKYALEDLAEGCWQAAAEGVAVDLRPFFREVHRTNMHKLTGPVREDGKQLKPVGWKPPRITAMYNRLLAGNPAFCKIVLPNQNGTPHPKHGIASVLPHPEGGHFCGECGGVFLETNLDAFMEKHRANG